MKANVQASSLAMVRCQRGYVDYGRIALIRMRLNSLRPSTDRVIKRSHLRAYCQSGEAHSVASLKDALMDLLASRTMGSRFERKSVQQIEAQEIDLVVYCPLQLFVGGLT
jgi:hypothetical protein